MRELLQNESQTAKHQVIAKVKFNSGIAIVLNDTPKLIYKRIGSNVIYGTDGLFYKCYAYERPSPCWQAFGGAKFDIVLEDGEVVQCTGQWWDAGHYIFKDFSTISLCDATVGTIEKLKKCYVFWGYIADKEKYIELLDAHSDLPVYPYDDYEKIIRYDGLRNKYYKETHKLEMAKKHLIKNVKESHLKLKQLTEFKRIEK